MKRTKRVSAVTVRKRIFTVFLCGLLVLMIIDFRLGYVQFVIGKQLTNKANNSWTRDITFEPDRGKILDRHGEVLAENVSAPTVILVPRQIKKKQETAEKLAKILDMPLKKAYEYVTRNASKVKVHPKGRKISKEQERAFRTLDMDGVYLAKDSKRSYPNGNRLSHVLGFTGIDNQGLMGLELYYNDKLKGEKGSLSFYSDTKGNKLKNLADVYKAPVDGLNLETTIDMKVQTIMDRELDLATARYHPDGALAIAVNPKTGGILGMSSRPDFNPEDYQHVNPDIYNRNAPIWKTYEPGSTFKIITLASALEENVVNLKKDTFDDDGSISVAGSQLHCWKRGGHGHQTFLEVVQNSCNPGFVKLGMKLGKKRLFSYIKDFGFGKKTGIDLKGEGTGILFNPDKIGPLEVATTAFGQGVSVTPIQQVMAVASAVNGGYLYQPHIAKEWIDPQTKQVVNQVDPTLKKRVISSETSKKVRMALESVVAHGTGRPAYVDGYRVGGKTGTAQKVGANGQYLKNDYIVSFIGFAPADDPQIVVYVAIDHPRGTIQFGGPVVGPIVGHIIGDSLQAMGVKPRKGGLEKKTMWPDQPKVEVPNLVGLQKEKLTSFLTDLSIKANGSGDYIIDQVPEAGTKVEQGSEIRIYLSDNKNKQKKTTSK